MGIGQLYKSVAQTLNLDPITVDQDIGKRADFPSIGPAILSYENFLVGHICTPNYTHEKLARSIAPFCKIVIIEKPGLKDVDSWSKLVRDFPDTRFMMVKNNMWRGNIGELKELADKARTVNIRWIRKNCIPSPGSWFTTRDLAFGGVSRDLMPHLLSLYIALNPNWRSEAINNMDAQMMWNLKDIESTEYGVVNPNGTYDVDDKCHVDFGSKWGCQADWRSMTNDDSSIQFIMQDNSVEAFELGWCPEEAYVNMVKTAIDNIDNDDFWQEQLEQDIWIHKVIGKL